MQSSNGTHPDGARPTVDAPPDPVAVFRDLVALEAQGKAEGSAFAAEIRQPGVLDSWRDALVDLVSQTMVEQQAARARVEEARGDYTTYREAMREHAGWSRRAGHFRACVETRLRECKRLQRERDEGRSRATRTDLVSRVETLEFEVRRLRRSVQVVAEEVAS